MKVGELTPAVKTGRSNQFGRDGGRIVHLVVKKENSWDKALCGTKPGRLSAGWYFAPARPVTCKKCNAVRANRLAKKLRRLEKGRED